MKNPMTESKDFTKEQIGWLCSTIMSLKEENTKLKLDIKVLAKQLTIPVVGSSLMDKKTKIKDWDKLDWCNVRLRNNLFVINRIVNGQFETVEYIEDITKRWFMKSKGIGKKSWREFVELRGY